MSSELETKTFSVEVIYAPESENILGERWLNQFGELDRLGDLPAHVDYCPDTGLPIHEQYHNGKGVHRMGDKPAKILSSRRTGVRIIECYMIHGNIHRDGDKPAYIRRAEDGTMLEQSYWKHGNLHRDPKLGPSKIYHDPETGEIARTEFWVEGQHIEGQVSKPRRLDI